MFVGKYRGYTSLVDDFVLVFLQTEDGKRLGWPFQRDGTGQNPKDIVFAPSVSSELKAYILSHPTTRAKTHFEKD